MNDLQKRVEEIIEREVERRMSTLEPNLDEVNAMMGDIASHVLLSISNYSGNSVERDSLFHARRLVKHFFHPLGNSQPNCLGDFPIYSRRTGEELERYYDLDDVTDWINKYRKELEKIPQREDDD